MKDSEVLRIVVHCSAVHQDVGRTRQARRSSLDAWTAHWSGHHYRETIGACVQGVYLMFICVYGHACEQEPVNSSHGQVVTP